VSLFSADSFDEAFLNLAELIIAKQHNGPTGDVPLVFLREFTRFESRAKNRAV
jgi:replicative DNA helicase